jgi:hypothetical protein
MVIKQNVRSCYLVIRVEARPGDAMDTPCASRLAFKDGAPKLEPLLQEVEIQRKRCLREALLEKFKPLVRLCGLEETLLVLRAALMTADSVPRVPVADSVACVSLLSLMLGLHGVDDAEKGMVKKRDSIRKWLPGISDARWESAELAWMDDYRSFQVF